jgi:hypothetical protein
MTDVTTGILKYMPWEYAAVSPVMELKVTPTTPAPTEKKEPHPTINAKTISTIARTYCRVGPSNVSSAVDTLDCIEGTPLSVFLIIFSSLVDYSWNIRVDVLDRIPETGDRK